MYFLQRVAAALQHADDERDARVAQKFQVRDGVEPLRRAGAARDERQLALLRPLRRPLEVVLGRVRLAVFVDAHERHVEVVAREVEVVRVAAEEGRLELGREDEPHVRVLLVEVEVVHAALIERDHVGAKARRLRRLGLDAADLGLARARRRSASFIPALTAPVTRAVTSSMRTSWFECEPRHLQLLGARVRDEAGLGESRSAVESSPTTSSTM